MNASLKRRLLESIRQTLTRYPGAWMVWCDPRGDWLPLLHSAAASPTDGFALLALTEETAGHFGGPQARQRLQQRLDAGQSFVLVVPRPANDLGWLWAQALLAERIYDRPLRDQLLDWGWHPQSITIGDDELLVLAQQHLHEDPAEWGGGGLQPDLSLLLEVLAGGARPVAEQRFLLDLTIEQAGLPRLEQDDLARWRTRCLGRLLVTQAAAVAPHLVGEEHEFLIAQPCRARALQVLARWSDSQRLGKHLPDAIVEADKIVALGKLALPAQPFETPFLSQAAEQAAFTGLCARLAQQDGKTLLEELASLGDRLASHAQGFWGHGCTHPKAVPWDELQRLSDAARRLLEATPGKPWEKPQDAIGWYVTGGWRADRAGEEILREITRPTPDLLQMITPLRSAYRARWENLMIQWSAVWTAAGCPAPALASAGTWLATQLQQKRPTAILLLDALRFDLGATLAEQLNRHEGTERALLRPARAPLPSITALGMGMALPIAESDLQADVVDGKWQLHRKGHIENLSHAAQRRQWWQQYGVPAAAQLDLAAVQAGLIPAPAPSRARLVVHDAAIDKLGHDDELEFQGSGLVLERYISAIGRLRDAGWRRILIVTDHGYIHWPSSEEKNAPFPAPDPVYAARRALAYPLGVPLAGPHALAPGDLWQVACPSGAASFRAYGGLGYFHGGAALQEWIIPCLAIEWPQEAQPVGVELLSADKILGKRPRVKLHVVRASLLVAEGLPRQVEVLIRHAATRMILFRSAPESITPDQDEVAVGVAAVEGVTASRFTKLRVEVRDAATEEVLDEADSVLMIELTEW